MYDDLGIHVHITHRIH